MASILMLGANRDESLSRPALSPHVLVRQPRIVAGHDCPGRGYVAGVQERDFAVALLNRIAPEGAGGHWNGDSEPDRSRRSLELLCLDALRMNSVQHALTWLADEVLDRPLCAVFALRADGSGAHVAAWDGAAVRTLELRPG